IAVMEPGSVLLNFARDAIVDEDAVIAALRTHRLKYYFCDFPSAKLMGEQGVVALPHLGASTEEAEENCAVMVVHQVRDFLDSGGRRNVLTIIGLLENGRATIIAGCSPIAQLVERRTVNPQVPCSSPGRGANYSIACVASRVSLFGGVYENVAVCLPLLAIAP